jgi:hypothetical protein
MMHIHDLHSRCLKEYSLFKCKWFKGVSSAPITVLITVLSIQVMYAQSGQTPHTLKLDEKADPAQASIADLKWLAGHWTGPAFGGICDEIWSQPTGDSMVGMFRLVQEWQDNVLRVDHHC